MTSTSFSIEKTYKAPSDLVWKALSDRDQMKQWYFDLAEFKPEVGFEFRFSAKGKDGDIYHHLCVVTEVIPGKKLSYSWCYEGFPGNSLVTFELLPENEGTRLRLTHSGLDSFASNGPDFAKESFAEGWTYILGTSLQAYLEKV
jgi:uncharacterized protein YndB with AHSA1/START domain